MKAQILIVDDERSLREFLEILFKKEGLEVTTAAGGRAAVELIDQGREFDMCLVDLMMPDLGGIGVLEAVKERFPETQVLMMTAYATADTAIEAMKKGAYDYIQKPFKVDEIKVVVNKGLAQRRLLQENRALRKEVRRRYSFDNIIGRSSRMQAIFEIIERIATTRTSVLITGESGTGKELIARAIHHNSSRSAGPLITVNCGAIPDNLIESELFGHKRGAFTGAVADKDGMFQAADGGTIFLDEVGELPMHLQVKLLRALQERQIRPVGSTAEASVDVRVVAATNQDLEAAISEGRFREDLFYRLNVIRVEMPPLRDRPEDILLIAQHFLRRFAEEMGKAIDDFEPDTKEALMSYAYPGNVRELENVIERAVTFETSSKVQRENLPPQLLSQGHDAQLLGLRALPMEGVDLETVLADIEKRLLGQALERTGGNRTEAARLLGISFRSIRYKLDKYDMSGEGGGG